MSHPLLWPKTFFYPIGNTSPVCLTQDLCPEESASVLLLGCGDPRSILYTIYAGAKSPGRPRTLDFTCCDNEPAVLARNVLLFTLVVDGHPAARIWNIFYHFKLDDSSSLLLVQQSEKLAALSRDLDSWSSSPYFSFLRVCSRSTLSQLRHLWQLYARARTFPKRKTNSLVAAFGNCGKAVTFNLTASRSAGPFWVKAVKALESHSDHYWRTGTVFSEPADVASATFINPTFIYSQGSEGCAIHYGTYPLQSFHLASAYASASGAKKDVTASDLVSCAQSQFQQWCCAFKAAVSPTAHDKVRIRLLAGDALALCHTLNHFRRTSSTSASLFLPAWTAVDLILDGGDYDTNLASPAPTIFNVIDTSNVVDYVGLLNILIATIPVLSHKPSSTLYTETLRVVGKDPLTGFTQRLCAEIPTISLLCGIAPTAYLSNFTSHSNIHEVMLKKCQSESSRICGPQYHERIAWKIPYLGDAVALRDYTENRLYPSFEPLTLAKLLFNIYYRMFEDEDVAKASWTETPRPSIINYDRGTFAAFLGLVKSRVQTDWNLVMDHIFDMIEIDDKLMLDSNNYQELCCQLYLRGVYAIGSFIVPPKIDRSQGRFRGWKDVPLVVCVVLVVPRDKIKVLEEMDSNELGSPMLQCNIRSPTFHNIFSSIQLVFGSVTVRGSGSNVRVVVNEDATGLSGTSSLVMSVWIPSFNLALDPLRTQIGLGVRATPIAVRALRPKLGLLLPLFSVPLMDPDMVYIATEWPKTPAKADPSPTLMSHSQTAARQNVSVSADNLKISTLAVKWEIKDVAPQDVQAEVCSEQVSPCVMKVTLGQVSKNLVYPFPINGKQSRLRVARKSGWIEVIAPVSTSPCIAEGGFSIKNFPLLLSQDVLLTVWNIHRLNLERLPAINVRTHKPDWICPHVSLALSDRELEQRAKGSGEKQPVESLVQVKDTLRVMFMHSIEPNACRIFGFSGPEEVGIYTIIFVNRLCLDLASHTLVADTCILPLTPPFMEKHGQLIAKLTQGRKVMWISTTGNEIPAWKHLLPVFVERCRTTWSHKPATCQYLKTGNIPLSLELDQSPICGCGEGVQLGTFSKTPEWKPLAPFVTRAAFSPLFAVSYLENVSGSIDEMAGFRAGLKAERKGDDDPQAVCAKCKRLANGEEKVLRCSRCKETSYCGQGCQKADWSQHKKLCKAK